jgi:hypothetical protein
MSATVRTVLVGFITLLLLVGLVFEIYFLKKIEADIASATSSADNEIGDDSRLRGIVELQELVKGDLEVFEDAILTRSDLVSVVEGLEKIGRGMGLSVSVTSIANENVKASQATEQVFRVSVETNGAWDKSLSFVRMFESLPYKLSIERIDLSLDGDDWRTNTSIRLSTYPER